MIDVRRFAVITYRLRYVYHLGIYNQPPNHTGLLSLAISLYIGCGRNEYLGVFTATAMRGAGRKMERSGPENRVSGTGAIYTVSGSGIFAER